MQAPFNIGQKLFGFDGMEFKMPIIFWHKWPKFSNDNGLLGIRQNTFTPYLDVSWHSNRHYPRFNSLRYRALQAVCDGDIEKLEACLAEGWNPNQVIDTQHKYNAVSLACHLDKLEVLHCLDQPRPNQLNGAGKFNGTPMMSALHRWNVRIVDYLMERGVDPFIKDSFGFTVKQKARIKQLRTIHSMLDQYEAQYKEKSKKFNQSPITNEGWAQKFNSFYESNGSEQAAMKAKRRGQKSQERNKFKGETGAPQHPTKYQLMELKSLQNPMVSVKPSEMLVKGEYPFSNFTDNMYTHVMFGNFQHFNSGDRKFYN